MGSHWPYLGLRVSCLVAFAEAEAAPVAILLTWASVTALAAKTAAIAAAADSSLLETCLCLCFWPYSAIDDITAVPSAHTHHTGPSGSRKDGTVVIHGLEVMSAGRLCRYDSELTPLACAMVMQQNRALQVHVGGGWLR